jgi:hypothetical protein
MVTALRNVFHAQTLCTLLGRAGVVPPGFTWQIFALCNGMDGDDIDAKRGSKWSRSGQRRRERELSLCLSLPLLQT